MLLDFVLRLAKRVLSPMDLFIIMMLILKLLCLYAATWFAELLWFFFDSANFSVLFAKLQNVVLLVCGLPGRLEQSEAIDEIWLILTLVVFVDGRPVGHQHVAQALFRLVIRHVTELLGRSA